MDRKEVFDYLRNHQKAEEIESKVNGINLWVLLGAIALLFWQLISTFDSRLITDFQSSIRVIFLADLIHTFIRFSGPSSVTQTEARYSQGSFLDPHPSMLDAMRGLATSVPSVLMLFFVERNIPLTLMAVMESLGIISTTVSFIARFFKYQPKQKRFPEPAFKTTPRQHVTMLFITVGLTVWLGVEQGRFFASHLAGVSDSFTKSLILLGGLYLLSILAMERSLRSHGIGWTYRMETALLTGQISHEVAIRQIETRALGRSLHRVMDRFFEEVSDYLDNAERALSVAGEQVLNIQTIPVNYAIERTTRIETLTSAVQNQIEKAEEASKEFTTYLERLVQFELAPTKEGTKALLDALKTRQSENTEKLKVIKVALAKFRSEAKVQAQ